MKVTATGSSFIYTYHRTGVYPMSFPFTPGLEGADAHQTLESRSTTGKVLIVP